MLFYWGIIWVAFIISALTEYTEARRDLRGGFLLSFPAGFSLYGEETE
jgi:hypothetical protein